LSNILQRLEQDTSTGNQNHINHPILTSQTPIYGMNSQIEDQNNFLVNQASSDDLHGMLV